MTRHPARALIAALISVSLTSAPFAQAPEFGYRILLEGVDAENDAGPELPLAIGNGGGTHQGAVGAPMQIPAPSVSGGRAPYAFELDRPLPAGLGLAGGAISGTPATAGDWQGVLTIRDSGTQSAQVAISISILQAGQQGLTAALNAAPRASMRDNASYGIRTVVPDNGTAPYSYQLVGSPPPGLSVDASGILSASGPLPTGTYSYAVRVTDSSPEPATAETATYQLEVYGAVTAEAATASGRGRVPLSVQASFANAAEPQLALAGGALPAGMSIQGTAIAGTPTVPGTYSGTLRLRDQADGASATFPFEITVLPSLDIAFAQADSPTGKGMVGAEIAPITASAVNGLGAVTFAEDPNSTYPATLASVGLALSPSGEITGTPVTASGAQVRIAMTEVHQGVTATVHKTLKLAIYDSIAGLPTVIQESNGAAVTGELYDNDSTTTVSSPAGGGFTFTFTEPTTLDGLYAMRGGSGTSLVRVFADGVQVHSVNANTTAISRSWTPATARVWRVTFGASNTFSRMYLSKSGTATPVVPSFPLGTAVTGVMGETLSLAPGAVSNAEGAVTWDLQGEVPAGVQANPATGEITGSPEEYGIFRAHLVATDSRGYSSARKPVRIQTFSDQLASAHIPRVTLSGAGGDTDVTSEFYDGEGGGTSIASVRGTITFTFDRPVSANRLLRTSSRFGERAVPNATKLTNVDTGETWEYWYIDAAGTNQAMAFNGGAAGSLGSTGSTGRVWQFNTGSTGATITTFKLAWAGQTPLAPSLPSVVATTSGNHPPNTVRTIPYTVNDAAAPATVRITARDGFRPPDFVEIDEQAGVVRFSNATAATNRSFTIEVTDARGLTGSRTVSPRFQ